MQVTRQKYVFRNRENNLFFDFAVLGGKTQTIWTQSLTSAKMYDTPNDERAVKDLAAGRVNPRLIKVTPVEITFKVAE